MNKILLVTEKDLELTLREILSHLLTLAQVKNSAAVVILLLTKFIDFLKGYEKVMSARFGAVMQRGVHSNLSNPSTLSNQSQKPTGKPLPS